MRNPLTTRPALRDTVGYKECLAKIATYRAGFTFTVNFAVIPPAKAAGLRSILSDFVRRGFLEIVADGWDLDLINTDTTYKRTEVRAA